MADPLVRVDVEDGVAWLTLDDPSRRNPLSLAMAGELVAACDAVDADDSVGAVVVRGAGGYFSSGGARDELGRISADPYAEAAQRDLSAIYAAFVRFGALRVPSVAAVVGGATGAGLNLALAADVRVAALDAVFASGFAHLGIHPGGGHLSLLGGVGGSSLAVAMGVLGQGVSGERAAQLGLVWEAVPASEVEAAAGRIVRLAGRDPELARAVRASARAELGPPVVSWPVAVEIERGPQLRSFARKGEAGWRAR